MAAAAKRKSAALRIFQTKTLAGANAVGVLLGASFWTIAAHTFWKNKNTADMALYISTSTILVTAIVGFAIPWSAAYTEDNQQRLATLTPAQGGAVLTKESAKAALEDRLQSMQELQNAIATRLGATARQAREAVVKLLCQV